MVQVSESGKSVETHPDSEADSQWFNDQSAKRQHTAFRLSQRDCLSLSELKGG